MSDARTFSPTLDPRRVRAADGSIHTIPEGWSCLPPGDAGLTRRVKAAGPSWTVQEKVGRKLFSRGVWAPTAHITTAKAELEAERATPAYAKKRAAAAVRREEEQAEYVEDFFGAVASFLRFDGAWRTQAEQLAHAVTDHATPVGSGTVARTERIPVAQRAEAAVIAWMRHQTTAYDFMKVARVKGARREVRRELAEVSRAVLDLHRIPRPHGVAGCPLCKALAALPDESELIG